MGRLNRAIFGLLNLHLWRDMVPSRQELRGIGRSAWDHVRLRFPTGEEATRYNVIQKLSYLVLVLVLLPILVLAGLAMSPRLDAASPELLTIFGGRQQARTIHFKPPRTVLTHSLDRSFPAFRGRPEVFGAQPERRG